MFRRFRAGCSAYPLSPLSNHVSRAGRDLFLDDGNKAVGEGLDQLLNRQSFGWLHS
jgi:hypothetical protein